MRELGRHHRVQGSPGFAAAAEHVRAKAEAAGLSDAVVERFPADGETRYAHFRSYLGWEARSARLDEVSPRVRTIARFPDLPVALADYSQDADVTAPLVDVGAGELAQSAPVTYQVRPDGSRQALASTPSASTSSLPGQQSRSSRSTSS